MNSMVFKEEVSKCDKSIDVNEKQFLNKLFIFSTFFVSICPKFIFSKLLHS